MNEINQAIIFFNKDLKKLNRLIKQIKNNNIKNILIVGEIEKTDNDITYINTNLKGIDLLKEALNYINTPFVSFNGDSILEPDLVKYVLGSDFEKKNVIFTHNKFNINVKSDIYGHVNEINNTYLIDDILRITDIDMFKEYINKLDNYLDIVNKINFDEASINYFYYSKDDYDRNVLSILDTKDEVREISLVEVNKLKPIESHDKSRVEKLKNKILEEKVWTTPLIIENKHYMILDGHHRFEVSKLLKLKYVPAIIVDYNDIEVWSLRPEIKISQKDVKEFVIDNNSIYPYKTVKHKYSFTLPEISYEIGGLMDD